MRRLPENHPIKTRSTDEYDFVTTKDLCELAQHIKTSVRDAELHMRNSLKHALEAGMALCQAKALVPHGEWVNWFESIGFDFSERTAQRYMRVFRKWKKTSKTLDRGANPTDVSDLTISSVLEIHARHFTGAVKEATDTIPGTLENHREFECSEGKTSNNNHIACAVTENDASGVVSSTSEKQHVSPLGLEHSTASNVDPVKPRPLRVREGLMQSSDEWRTPEQLVQAAERMLGGIDLDPAADEDRSIPANKHYTLEINGLSHSQPWYGKLLLNPPVQARLIAKFVARLTNQFALGNVQEAILVVPARTNEKWFRKLRTHMRSFIAKPGFGSVEGMPEPIVAIYLGDRTNRFYDEFERHGDCYVPYCAKHVRHLDHKLLRSK